MGFNSIRGGLHEGGNGLRAMVGRVVVGWLNPHASETGMRTGTKACATLSRACWGERAHEMRGWRG